MSSQFALVINQPATEMERDRLDVFEDLNRGERNGLRAFASFSEFEAPSKLVRIGLPSMRSLVSKGLAEEGPMGMFGPTFRLTRRGRALTSVIYGLAD